MVISSLPTLNKYLNETILTNADPTSNVVTSVTIHFIDCVLMQPRHYILFIVHRKDGERRKVMTNSRVPHHWCPDVDRSPDS